MKKRRPTVGLQPLDREARSRRSLLRSSLASLASIMASKALAACSSPATRDPERDASTFDAYPPDEGLDARLDDHTALDHRAIDTAVTDTTADAATDAAAYVFRRRIVPARPSLRSRIADIGPLSLEPDANGLRLPPGFTARVVAEFDRPVGDTSHRWHIAPDGGATFATEDGGWIYVSNSEQIANMGGVGAIRFDTTGRITRAYRILERTNLNCAGGPTPWHTWLSCEEFDRGRVWECDPWGEQRAVARPALGVFEHEAITVDHDRWHLYMTEDVNNGRLYRYVPAAMNALGFPDLSRGTLEVAVVDAMGHVTWRAVPDPTYSQRTPTRYQVPESAEFNGGEGIWYHDHIVYFATKGDDRVWAYDTRSSMLTILYDFRRHPEPRILTGVDNITVSCCGDVLVAEDQGSMDIVAILPSGELKQLVQVVDQERSEITGPAFDPSGTRLYFSSQRSPAGGTTFEITGPFHEPV
jgi:secreted PhoX family phosphatase